MLSQEEFKGKVSLDISNKHAHYMLVRLSADEWELTTFYRTNGKIDVNGMFSTGHLEEKDVYKMYKKAMSHFRRNVNRVLIV